MRDQHRACCWAGRLTVRLGYSSDSRQPNRQAKAEFAKYLPASVKVPERDGRQISLVDLATHTSGLPRMPANFRPKDPANPYADYTDEQLYSFLSSYDLIRDIGLKFEYSNLGFGLLGQGLARRAGTGYETLVETRICEPLGMKSTRITLSPDMERRFAAGHSADLVTVSRWDIPSLAGAGALRSTANDLLIFFGGNDGLCAHDSSSRDEGDAVDYASHGATLHRHRTRLDD
jgi:serine-type D-Ala-D-Ala carboxypeptidase/endopeptidase